MADSMVAAVVGSAEVAEVFEAGRSADSAAAAARSVAAHEGLAVVVSARAGLGADRFAAVSVDRAHLAVPLFAAAGSAVPAATVDLPQATAVRHSLAVGILGTARRDFPGLAAQRLMVSGIRSQPAAGLPAFRALAGSRMAQLEVFATPAL